MNVCFRSEYKYVYIKPALQKTSIFWWCHKLLLLQFLTMFEVDIEFIAKTDSKNEQNRSCTTHSPRTMLSILFTIWFHNYYLIILNIFLPPIFHYSLLNTSTSSVDLMLFDRPTTDISSMHQPKQSQEIPVITNIRVKNFLLWMQPRIIQKDSAVAWSLRNNTIRCFPKGIIPFKCNTLQVGCLNRLRIVKRMVISRLPH